MLNRADLNLLTTAILDAPVIRKKSKLSLKEIIHKSCSNVIHLEIMEYLDKYDKYINKVCNHRRYYLHDEVSDCKQFVLIQLFKNYHKRHRYSDWEKVTSSMIKRKIIDFSKTRNCTKKSMVLEADLKTDDDERGYLDMGLENFSEHPIDLRIEDGMLERFKHDLFDSNLFNDDERKYLTALFNEFEGNYTIPLMRLSKVNSGKVADVVHRGIVIKIQNHFKIEEYL